MKQIQLFLIAVFFCMSGYAQDCYNATRTDGMNFFTQGKTLFNQGKKAEAKKQIVMAKEYFKAAQSCPDKPANNDLKSLISLTNSWIQRCDGATSVCVVKDFYFTSAGSSPKERPYYTNEMQKLSPNILIESDNNASKTSEISLLIVDPSGVKLSNGKERTAVVSLVLNDGDNTVSFPQLGAFSKSFKAGTYTLEVWCDDKSVYKGSFVVEQPKTEEVTDNKVQETSVRKPEKVSENMSFADRLTFKVGAAGVLGFFSTNSSGVIGSVIDYGLTDVATLSDYEIPTYKSKGGFIISALADIALTDALFVETGLSFRHIAISNNFYCDKLVFMSTYAMDYGCTERYRMNSVDIPALVGFAIPMTENSAISFTTGPVFSVGISAKCKLTDGYSNYATTDGAYYAKSSFSGNVNLYTGEYDMDQDYSTGSSPHYDVKGKVINPLKRMGLGWNLGAAYTYGNIEFAFNFVMGINNVANQDYWRGTNRIGGLFFAGEPVRSSRGINSYRQRVNYLDLSFRYKF